MSDIFQQAWLTKWFNALNTLTETALKDITHRITRPSGDSSTITYVTLVHVGIDAETEQGLLTVMLLLSSKYQSFAQEYIC